MNEISGFSEVSVEECKLSELSDVEDVKDIDVKELDKPIAYEVQSFSTNENSEANEVKSDATETSDNTDNTTDSTEKAELEYDENGTRELTEDEKQMLKDKLGWSDEKIDNNCRIDKDGVIHYKTDKQDMEGQTSECGVAYEKRRFEYNGVIIEGVFPVFESVFDTNLDTENYQSSGSKQFSEANKKLSEAVENDPDLKKQFTKEQLEDIAEGRTPRGYTWHHNEEPGKMQLVKTPEHDRRVGGAAHTGGNSIWGNKSIDTSSENLRNGVTF